MKIISILIAAIAMAGCAGQIDLTSTDNRWVSSYEMSQTPNEDICVVTAKEIFMKNPAYSLEKNYYPYIEIEGQDVSIGLVTNDRFKSIAGDIELQIDDNKPWYLNINNTPKDFGQKLNNQSENGRNDLPYFTATNGEDAIKIIEEIKQGKTLKYKSVGLFRINTIEGEYDIDSTFNGAMSECKA